MSGGGAAARLLADRARTSRELGARADLVLDGGGNTSVKTPSEGDDDALLWVKPSGHDLARVEAQDFVPLDLARVCALRDGPALGEVELHRALADCKLREADPSPSIESLLHGWLPGRYVDHSHAAAVQVLGNCDDGEAVLREVYGDRAAVVAAADSGYPVAAAAAELFDARGGGRDLEMLVLRHHGLFTWADDADRCLDRHLELAAQAEAALDARGAPRPRPMLASAGSTDAAREVEAVQASLAAATGACWHETGVDPRYFELPDARVRACAGPLTPGDLLRLGARPLWLTELDENAVRTQARTHAAEDASGGEPPRAVLVPALRAAFAAGETEARADAAARILEQDLAARLRGSVLGSWKSLSPDACVRTMNSLLEQGKLASGLESRP